MNNTHPQTSGAILQIGQGADHFLAKPLQAFLYKNMEHVLNVVLGTGAILGYLVILRVLRVGL
jgi:hypothetical protein